MKNPLVILTVFVCLGILLGEAKEIPFSVSYATAAATLLIMICVPRRRLLFNAAFAVFFLFLGCASVASAAIIPRCHFWKIIAQAPSVRYTFKGTIASLPAQEEGSTIFELRVEEVHSQKLQHRCCGSVLVRVNTELPLRFGQEVCVEGGLRFPFTGHDPSRRIRLPLDQLHPVMRAQSTSSLAVTGQRSYPVRAAAVYFARKAHEIIARNVRGAAAGVLEAMIIGKRHNLPRTLIEEMTRSGTVHILVVSGFNVALLTGTVLCVFKLLRMPRRIRYVAAIPVILLYAVATGASTPVVRATVMALIFLVAHLIRREPAAHNALAIACVVIVLFQPYQLFDIGFQLSFASVAGLIAGVRFLRRFVPAQSLRLPFMRALIEGCLASFAAWLATAGLVAFYFRFFSPVAVAANLLIVPLASLITLCGFSLVATGMLLPPLALPIGRTCELLIVVLVKLNEAMLKVPYGYWSW